MEAIAPSNLKNAANVATFGAKVKRKSIARRGSMFSLSPTSLQEQEALRQQDKEGTFDSRLSFSEGPQYVEKKVERFENSYIMDPEYDSRFFGPVNLQPKTEEIREVARHCLESNLQGEEYDPMMAREFSRNLAEEIKRRVKSRP